MTVSSGFFLPMIHNNKHIIYFMIQILDLMFYYVSCCQSHNRPVNYVTIYNQDRKYVSQYKLHANKRI